MSCHLKFLRTSRHLLSVFACALMLQGLASADLADDLVAYWPLDDDFVDQVGEFDGEEFGSVEIEFEAGKFGNGIVLNGEDQYVEIVGGEADGLDFVDEGSMSISAWFRVDAFDTSWQALIAKGEQDAWRLHRNSGNCGMAFTAGEPDATSSICVNDGEIHHVVATSDEGFKTIWIDGQWAAEGQQDPIGLPDTNNPVRIGDNPSAPGREWEGLIDEVAIWSRALTEDEVLAIWNNGAGCEGLIDCVPPPRDCVGGCDTIGQKTYEGERSNEVYGPPTDEGPGLYQEWYAVANPGNKDGVDAIFEGEAPMVPPFRAENGATWWTGSQPPIGDLVAYPDEVQPPFNNTDNDNYTVRLTGEILIPEPGTYRFADGVDDFCYVAIDLDKSGIAGDAPDEVLINDNTWTNPDRANNGGGAGWAEVEIDVAAEGEWLAIEFNMAEGGGGDHGVLHWDYNPDAPEGQRLAGQENFPEIPEDPVYDPVDAETVTFVPDTHLRSSIRELLSADLTDEVTTDRPWEFDLEGGDPVTCDQMVLPNPDPDVYTTTLNVEGVTFHIKGTGALADGDSCQIVDADQIVGIPTITSENTEQTWTFSNDTGLITLGTGPTLPGDHDGSGVLDAADLDLQAVEMQKPVGEQNLAEFDLNNSGAVDFDDRKLWVEDQEFKHTWIGDANLDLQFNSGDMVQVFSRGKYETGDNAGWEDGDWNGDTVFGSGDMVAAFVGGGYEQGQKPAISAVPEPSSVLLAVLAALSLVGLARRR